MVMVRSLFAVVLVASSCFAGFPTSNLVAPAVKMEFTGPVNSQSAGALIMAIESLNARVEPPSAIYLEINSPGGGIDSGFLVSKAIEQSKVPVVCIVDGMAASMAFYILQSCHVRAMTPRSIIMIHRSKIGADMVGQADIFSIAGELAARDQGIIEHIAARMKTPKSEISSKIAQGDWWMSAESALAAGAVDIILPVSEVP